MIYEINNRLTLLGSFWLSLRWTTGPGCVFRSLHQRPQHFKSDLTTLLVRWSDIYPTTLGRTELLSNIVNTNTYTVLMEITLSNASYYDTIGLTDY